LNTLLYYLFYIFYIFIKYTPNFLKKPILHLFYILVYNFDFFRKKVVLANLKVAFPSLSENERKKIAKQFYKNFISYIADMVESLQISKEELSNKVEVIGEENIKKALSSGKPVVFMTAHFGNWEVAPKIIGAFYNKLTVLMREFDNPKLGEFFKKSRNSFNISTLNKKSSAREIIKALKSGNSLGILIDQHSKSPKAEKVLFFNQEVAFNKAVSTLSKKFDAVIVPFFTYTKDKYVIEFLEPKSIGEESIQDFTQWQATVIEDMIKKHPSEYYWFHKRFKLMSPEIYK
jgi:KDO2-lipid IV(A) lauroyltransferase